MRYYQHNGLLRSRTFRRVNLGQELRRPEFYGPESKPLTSCSRSLSCESVRKVASRLVTTIFELCRHSFHPCLILVGDLETLYLAQGESDRPANWDAKRCLITD